MYVLTIETERGAAAKVLGLTGSEGESEGVRGKAGCFVNKVGRAVCGLVCYMLPMQAEFPRFGRSTFRDLSMGTLHSFVHSLATRSLANNAYKCVITLVIKLPR